MDINAIKGYFIGVAIQADANIDRAFDDYLSDSRQRLVDFAPVDSGNFKSLWKSSGVANSEGKKSATVSNEAEYAPPIEFGSAPGEKPWPRPGDKTVAFQGRIFSSQAPGGTIGKVFNEESADSFANDISNSITMAFK